MTSRLTRGRALLLALAAMLLLAPLTGRTDDAGAEDAGPDADAADAGGEGGPYTMSGSAESGCTCAAPGQGPSAGSEWPTSLGLLVGLLSPPG